MVEFDFYLERAIKPVYVGVLMPRKHKRLDRLQCGEANQLRDAGEIVARLSLVFIHFLHNASPIQRYLRIISA
jgi:hypothetical protein